MAMAPIVTGCVLGWLEAGAGSTIAALRLDIFLSALLTSVFIQIGTNLHNDAIDTLNGTDTDDRLGPTRVTQQGWLSPKTVITATHLCFLGALVCGLYLVWLGGWPYLLLGLVSILAGYSYSAGPWPLSRNAFGELFVFIFYGLVGVCGAAFLYTKTIEPSYLLAALPAGLPHCAVLLVNHTRDISSDIKAGRKTLAILIGRQGASKLYGWFMLGGLIGACALAMLGPQYWPSALALVCAPFVFRDIRAFRSASSGTEFNIVHARTTSFQLYLSLIMCVGLFIFNYTP